MRCGVCGFKAKTAQGLGVHRASRHEPARRPSRPSGGNAVEVWEIARVLASEPQSWGWLSIVLVEALVKGAVQPSAPEAHVLDAVTWMRPNLRDHPRLHEVERKLAEVGRHLRSKHPEMVGSTRVPGGVA